MLLLMLGLTLAGYVPISPLKIGASDPIGIVLTVALVVVVNLIIYVLKRALKTVL